MKKIYLLFFVLVLFSCRSDEFGTTETELLPEKIYKHIFGPDELDGSLGSHYYQFLSYNSQKKLIKVEREYSFGKPPVYMSVEYSANTAIVKDKSDGNYITSKDKTIYTFNNSGKIAEKLFILNGDNDSEGVKKYLYEYNSEGKLEKITLRYPNITVGDALYPHLNDIERIDLYYYEGNNLKKIISQSIGDYNSNHFTRNEILFSDYDNSKNPFKKLELIEFYFDRSLSVNNYRQMDTYGYDENNILILKLQKKWALLYDSQNNLMLTY